MAKQYDLKDLGEVYGNLGKETAVLAEETQSLTVGDAKAGIGSADILPGGPTKEGGFEEPTVDVTKSGDKNPYNVKAYSYGAGNDPGVGAEEPAPTGEDALHGEEDEEDSVKNKKKADLNKDGKLSKYEKKRGKAIEDATDEEGEDEDEESSEKDLEMAQEGLNTFMANKSVFDRLYNKVMVNESYEMEEMDDLAALGIDDAAPDAEGEDGDSEEEVTITLDRDMAKHLCDILKDACGEDDDDVEVEVEDGERHHEDGEGHHSEEDEEGEPHAMNTHYNDGKSNKVGNVTGLGGNSGGHADTGSTAEVLHHKVSDGTGKNNKVGNLPAGKNMFGDVKVQPMNKAVKA